MLKILRTMLMAGLVLSAPRAASAQAGMIWGEIGHQKNEFGNGSTSDGLAWGGGLQVTISGDSSKNSGFAVPLGFEARGDKHFNGADLLGTADFVFRVRSVSFGPGGSFGYIFRPNVADPRCLAASLPSGTSCYFSSDRRGLRDIGQFYGLGLSGVAKISFGPQGRAFVQGRFIYYAPAWVSFRSSAEGASAVSGISIPVPTDFPEFDHGRDVRLSTGYVFGGADKVAKVVRVQYVNKDFEFTHTGANTTGVFNQTGNQVTFGFGVTF